MTSRVLLKLRGSPLGLGGMPCDEIGGHVADRYLAMSEQPLILVINPCKQLAPRIEHLTQLCERLGLDVQLPSLLGDLPLLPQDVEIDLLEVRLSCVLGRAPGHQRLKVFRKACAVSREERGLRDTPGDLGIGEQAGLEQLRAGYARLPSHGPQSRIVEHRERHHVRLREAFRGIERLGREPRDSEVACWHRERWRAGEIGTCGQGFWMIDHTPGEEPTTPRDDTHHAFPDGGGACISQRPCSAKRCGSPHVRCSRASCCRRQCTYSAGIKLVLRIALHARPPKMTTARPCSGAAPWPRPNAVGSIPSIAVTAVSTIGRKRTWIASRTASSTAMPCVSFCFARSSRTML